MEGVTYVVAGSGPVRAYRGGVYLGDLKDGAIDPAPAEAEAAEKAAAERREQRDRALGLAGGTIIEGGDEAWFGRAAAFAAYAGSDEAKWGALCRAISAYDSTEGIIARADRILNFLENGLPPSDPQAQEAA